MKYSVVHLLTGDAREYHLMLTRQLSSRFRTVPLHRKVPPHITVKPPFEANAYEIGRIEEHLADFSSRHASEPLTMSGFGRFGFKTVYLDIVKSRPAVGIVRDCIQELNQWPFMNAVRYEGDKLHTSVARYMKYRQFRRVWRHLKAERPHFKARFDSLALLRKEPDGRAWEIYREFSLLPASSSERFLQGIDSLRCGLPAAEVFIPIRGGAA